MQRMVTCHTSVVKMSCVQSRVVRCNGAFASGPARSNRRLVSQARKLTTADKRSEPTKFGLAMHDHECTFALGINGLYVQAALKAGDQMKDYPNYYKVVKNQEGKAVTLSSFQGKAPVVLFFYPKAGTPGCTKEACGFRDKYSQFTKAGAQVFGISSDTPAENKAFKEANRLPFDLITDENSILRKEFGIPNEMFVLPGRQTFVISKDGECIMSFNDMLNADAHIAEALKALKV